MKIAILGPGCPKCNAMEATVRSAADKLGITYELVHVTDITEFVNRGVMLTPALLIDGKVTVSGRVPSEAEITTMLTSAIAREKT